MLIFDFLRTLEATINELSEREEDPNILVTDIHLTDDTMMSIHYYYASNSNINYNIHGSKGHMETDVFPHEDYKGCSLHLKEVVYMMKGLMTYMQSSLVCMYICEVSKVLILSDGLYIEAYGKNVWSDPYKKIAIHVPKGEYGRCITTLKKPINPNEIPRMTL